MLEREVEPELAGEQVGQGRRRVDGAGLQPGPGRNDVSATRATDVLVLRAERAEAAQELDHADRVVGAQLGVKRPLADGLRQELADVAEIVGLGGAVADPLSGQRPDGAVGRLVVVPAIGVLIGEDLDGDAELAAVVERRVVLRDPGGPGVEVLALGERRGLDRPIDLGLRRPAADGPVAAAGSFARFEDLARVARLLELVGRRQPGDAGAQDQHARPVGAALEGEVGLAGRLERPPVLAGRGDEPERLHRTEDRGRAPGGTDRLQEPAPGDPRAGWRHPTSTPLRAGRFRPSVRHRGGAMLVDQGARLEPLEGERAIRARGVRRWRPCAPAPSRWPGWP